MNILMIRHLLYILVYNLMLLKILWLTQPFMEEGFFSRSVIYVAEHNATGSIGFVLTDPINRDLSDLFEELQGIDIPVYRGGPVSTECLYYLHRFPGLKGCNKIFGDIYWGGDFDHLRSLLFKGRLDERNIRFFTGYSGWMKGQLEEEIKQHSWLISPIETEGIFVARSWELWEKSMGKMGGHRKAWANFPKDPVMN